MLPDLIVDSLELIDPIHPNYQISYRYTIKNIGDGAAHLDGEKNDLNVSVQAYLSWDEVFNNEGDKPAGGTILGLSPLGKLEPGETRTGTFGATVEIDPKKHRYLVLKVDWGERIFELDEENNTLAALFGAPDDIDEGKKGTGDGAGVDDEAGVEPEAPSFSKELESQEWTNSQGQKIIARVLRIVVGHVIFQLESGEEVPYPIEDLSEESQEKLKTLTERLEK